MCLSSESYFDRLASFIHHLLILIIKSLSKSGLRLGYFQKIFRGIQDFFWVGMTKDIANFTQSCIICQRVGFKPKRVPIGEPPIVDAPFQKISIDLLGAIHPASDENHTHVLVVVDHATRYVLAECLTKIDSVLNMLLF